MLLETQQPCHKSTGVPCPGYVWHASDGTPPIMLVLREAPMAEEQRVNAVQVDHKGLRQRGTQQRLGGDKGTPEA
jgi:hypothetical protein